MWRVPSSLLPLLLILPASCAAPPPAWSTPDGAAEIHGLLADEELEFVAACSGNDWITLHHVENLLLSNGIPASSGGSVFYGIEVPRSLVPRAREELLNGQRSDVFTCSEIPPEGDVPGYLFVGWERPAQGHVTAYGRPLVDVLAETDPDSLLGAALAERHVQTDAEWLPILVEVTQWDRPFLGADGSWHTGAHMQVHLAAPPEGPTGRMKLRLAVFPAGTWSMEYQDLGPDGRPTGEPWSSRVQFLGSHGAGPATVR